MQSHYPLKYLYSSLLSASEMEPLSRFFRQALSIKDVSWEDMTSELRLLKSSGCEDFDRISGIYEYLHGMNIIQHTHMIR